MKKRVVFVKKKTKRATTRKKHMWRDYEKRDIFTPDIGYQHPSIRANRRGKTGKRLIIKIKGKA